LGQQNTYTMTEKAFVKRLERIFITEGFLTKKEVGAGYGVADLVLIRKEKLNVRHCTIRRDYGQFIRLLREEYFKILSYLPEKDSGEDSVSLDYLAGKTHLSKSFLKYNILRILEKNKYIKKEKGNLYFKINSWMPIADEVIAIEAKIRDWKRGFIQANRYKFFADKVYLAVPPEVAHLVDKKLLERHNVGLIILNMQVGEKKITLPCKLKEPLNNYKRNLAMEFFWGRQLLKEIALL